MMRQFMPSILLIIYTSLASAQVPKSLPPAAPPTTSAPDVAAIATLRTQWMDAFRDKHLEESVALYAPNAAILEPRGTRIEGQQSLHDLLQTVMAATDSTVQLNSLAVESNGDLAFDSGAYTATTLIHSTTTPIHIAGSYLTVYRRTPAGHWLILQQAWTLTPPATR
jgi:ketosteroid isomerase-like protein